MLRPRGRSHIVVKTLTDKPLFETAPSRQDDYIREGLLTRLCSVLRFRGKTQVFVNEAVPPSRSRKCGQGLKVRRVRIASMRLERHAPTLPVAVRDETNKGSNGS